MPEDRPRCGILSAKVHAGIPTVPDYGLNTIRRAINRYGAAPQLQMAIKEMSELTKAICNLQWAVTFNYRNGAKIKVAHESVREEIADVYIMIAPAVVLVLVREAALEVAREVVPGAVTQPARRIAQITVLVPAPADVQAVALARVINDIKTGYVSVYHYAGIPNMPGSAAYTSNWAAEIFGPGNLKKPTSGYPQRLYNSALQGALGINQDGVFGANTEKAVKEFQAAHGLTADGIVGTQTKAALSKLF